jgi:hypothetical protein
MDIYEKVMEKLGVAPDADLETVLQAVDNLQHRVQTNEGLNKNLKARMTELEDENRALLIEHVDRMGERSWR